MDDYDVFAGSFASIVGAMRRRHWFAALDELLHAAERLPLPDAVWEPFNWRARFCTWATWRYEYGAFSFWDNDQDARYDKL